MAGSVNKVIIIGNLGKDPEIRTLNSGERVANLTVATSEQWRDKASGERKEKTEWHRVVIFNDNLAKIAEQYLRKGSTVYLRQPADAQVDRPAGPGKVHDRNRPATLQRQPYASGRPW